jgi:hypothetical protein
LSPAGGCGIHLTKNCVPIGEQQQFEIVFISVCVGMNID